MATPVVTIATGGIAVVDVTATAPKLGLPVSEAANGRGIAVTKVAALGLPVTFEGAAAAVTHRYWRLFIVHTVTDNSFNIAEVELRSTAGGADQTGSGTASANPGTPASGVPANCFDNNAGTTFHSPVGAMPSWLTYDFGAGAPKDIKQVTIQAHPSNPGYSPTEFNVQFSDDGSAWTTAWGVVGSTGWVAGEIRTYTKP